MALIAGLVVLSLLAISHSSVVPIDHSSSSVSVKHSGKDYSYTIQETHGVGAEPINLVEQSSVHVVAKAGHPGNPAGDGVQHVNQHHDQGQGHLEHQQADHAIGHASGLIQGHNVHDDHHHQDQHNHGHGRSGLDNVIGLLPEQHQQQHHDQGQVGLRSVPGIQGQVIDPHVQGQFRAVLPVDPSQGQVRGVPVGNQAIVALPAQAVHQDHVEGSSVSGGQVVPVFSVSGPVQSDHEVNAVIPQHEQGQVEVRSFQGSVPAPSQFRAFQGNAQDQFGVNGFFPVQQQDQGQVKGFLVNKNQVQGIVSRFAGVPVQDGDVKGFFVDKNQVQGVVSRFAGVPTQENDVRRYFVDKNQVQNIASRFGLVPNQDSDVRGIFVDKNQLQGIVGRYAGIPSQESELKRFFVDKNQVQDTVGRFGGVSSQENDLKRFFVDKNQVQDVVGRYGMQNQDNILKSGVEAFRLVPARDVPVVQVSSGSGVRYPYAVLYPVYRYA